MASKQVAIAQARILADASQLDHAVIFDYDGSRPFQFSFFAIPAAEIECWLPGYHENHPSINQYLLEVYEPKEPKP